MRNGRAIMGFILLGFPGAQGLPIPLFPFIFLIYALNLAGSGLTIAIFWAQPRLQIPVAFSLCNLSFLEIWYSTTVTPKLPDNFMVARAASCIPCRFCRSSFTSGTTEFFLLSIMSFACYLTICKPLCYPTTLTSNISPQLALASGCWASPLFFGR